MNAVTILSSWETARRWLGRTGLLVVGCAIVVLASYCAGDRHGHATAHSDAYHVRQAARVDTITTVETRYVHDTIRATATKRAADVARQRADSAIATVEQAADTSTTGTLPVSMVVPALRVCQTALVADTITYQAQAAALVTMTEDRNLQRAGRIDAEAELAREQKSHRIGVKTGIVIGVLIDVLAHVAFR